MDAFKKQCYMKVNRAIKWFLKRQCGNREVPALLWAELTMGYGSGARAGFNAENNGLYIFWSKHEKTKLAELESGASRDGIHEAVHYPEINHLKNAALTFWKQRGYILTHNRLHVCTITASYIIMMRNIYYCKHWGITKALGDRY